MPSSSPDDTVKLFLSYAREDFEAVSALYDRLEALGLRPWMDKRDILPGERWRRRSCRRRVKQVRTFSWPACRRKSVEKRGISSGRSSTRWTRGRRSWHDDIYLIPVRLAECQVPEELEEFNGSNCMKRMGGGCCCGRSSRGREPGRSIPGELLEALSRKRLSR